LRGWLRKQELAVEIRAKKTAEQKKYKEKETEKQHKKEMLV